MLSRKLITLIRFSGASKSLSLSSGSLGHADQEIGDRYSKMEEDAEFCERLADAVGLGFQIPDAKSVTNSFVAPIAPKSQLEVSIA
jgi:hypothetical protein